MSLALTLTVTSVQIGFSVNTLYSITFNILHLAFYHEGSDAARQEGSASLRGEGARTNAGIHLSR